MLTGLAPLAALLVLLVAPAPPASAQSSAILPDSDLKALTASLRTYLEARSEGRDLLAPRQALAAELARLRKSDDGAAALRWSADLGRAWQLAQERPRLEGRPGKVMTVESREGGFAKSGLRFAYRLPRDYDPDARGYPLVLSIPDEGEVPAEHIRTHWTLSELSDAAIVLCPEMPADQGEWARVTIQGRAGGLAHVLTALRIAGERFVIDGDRIFVVGRGKGVPAALAAGNTSPQRFAAVLGRAGDAGAIGPENFGNLPTLFAGGGARARAFQETARAAGIDTCELRPEASEQDLWDWMQAHPRRAWPSAVRVQPGDPFPTRACWLRIAPMAVDARADGVIERETNTITIEGQGFSLATLYLNDELVDLDKPVRVVCNGVETSGLLPRRLSTALDLLVDGTSDANCVYVVEASFDASGEPPPATDEHADGSDSEFDGRFAAAGDDVVLLWDLVQWCRDNQREARVEPVLRKLVRLSPDHESARLALGQEQAHGLWFATPWARQRFEAGQDEATARQRGYVKYRSLWVHPGDRPNHGKGLTKDPMTGQWLALADQKRIAAGWARQDLEWIEPEQAASADAGLWRVQGEWLDLQAANRRHARIDSMWHIPGPEVLLHTTVDRAVALQAAFAMERAIDDLRRVFGAEPVLPLEVAVLRDEEQYDRFAFGDPDGLRRATHAGRLHAIHSAYFAESWFPRVEAKPTFGGLGVCYWDAQVPNGNLYGVHSARLAVGLSYVEALDPSPKAVRKALSSGPTAEYYQAYQDEKQLPAWLRHGGAVYAERFFRDDFVAEGNDPWWARQWSLDNLRSRGGLRSLDEVFAFELDADDREGSLKLLIEAGLLVAFAVDGACEPVSAAHEQLKAALAAGSSPTKAIAALREAIAGNESQLRAFAGQE